MSAVVEAVGDVFEAVGDAVGDVVEGIGDVVESVVDNVVEPVAKAVGNTIEAALDNPIGTIARVAAVATGQFQLLPLIGAAETAANGGDFGDILKSAAINYVAGQAGSQVGNFTGNAIAGNAAAGATDALLSGRDPLQGAISSALNSGFNQALDSFATSVNTPTFNDDDLSFSLPSSVRSGLDEVSSLDDDFNAIDRSSWDVKPADYSLIGEKSNVPTSQPGLNPAGSYLGLNMDSIRGQAPGLASMGGGSGLSIDSSAPLGDPNSFINNPAYTQDMPRGTVSAAGFIDENAMPALGDPASFINNPKVTGQPVIPTPSCAFNVNAPNVNIADLLNQRNARQNRALCLAFGGFDMNIPWLNTKAQMLNARPGSVGCASTTAAGAKPGDLSGVYGQMTPELTSVFAERGIGMPQPQQLGQMIAPAGMAAGPSAGLSSGLSAGLGFAPLMLAEGGSAETCSTWGAMGKYMPKFHGATSPSLLQTARTQRQSPTLAQLKQMYPAISQQGNMGGMARGGLPSKYQEAAPEGHNPEFITGLTGFYANGRGTGQSDDIPAMLHDGDYVMDADTVAALGDGSSKAGAQALEQFRKEVPHRMSTGGKAVPARIADGEYVFPESFVTALGNGDNKRGAKMLDAMRENLRAHKRSAPTSKIPPKALSPLDYLKKAK